MLKQNKIFLFISFFLNSNIYGQETGTGTDYLKIFQKNIFSLQQLITSANLDSKYYFVKNQELLPFFTVFLK